MYEVNVVLPLVQKEMSIEYKVKNLHSYKFMQTTEMICKRRVTFFSLTRDDSSVSNLI